MNTVHILKNCYRMDRFGETRQEGKDHWKVNQKKVTFFSH